MYVCMCTVFKSILDTEYGPGVVKKLFFKVVGMFLYFFIT